jgi:general secretion pathway protein A
MYKRLYGLIRNPFELSPDPNFYFPTRSHNEAFATLHYCVLRRRGFVVVSGEVGTGKTLVLRCLLDSLSANKVATAFVFNPQLSPIDFISYVLADLHVPFRDRSKGDMLAALNEFLLLRSRRGTTTVLVVDEAQLLSWELLEEIRLLTNLETSQFKLLQIVLVGQTELDRKIDSEQLRQLKQRIAMRYRLEPLGLEDMRLYIYHRLHLAGANPQGSRVFSDAAIEAIFRCSRGIPRLVNTLCENSLIAGYGRQLRQITPEIVQECAIDLRLNVVSEPTLIKPEWPDGRKRAAAGVPD